MVNILLTGPTGTGKSSLPKEFAAVQRRSFFTMHCQLVTEPGDWWGTREMSIREGTYFQKAALVDAMETPGCVVLLDEANRTHPENLNALFGLLDHRRRTWVPALNREVVVAPGLIFFVTLNEGANYVGTNAVDIALKDRISNTIRLDYLPLKVEVDLLVERTGIREEEARELSQFARTVRSNPKLGIAVSTRQLLECGALIKEELSIREAVLFAVTNGTGERAEQDALLQALQLAGKVDSAFLKRRWDDEE
ncbi:MAG: BssE [Dehalococcoidia bacterium]|nr:BssE [Dehalococcoidia bacterium]